MCIRDSSEDGCNTDYGTMAPIWNRIKGSRPHEYSRLPLSEKDSERPNSKYRTHRRRNWRSLAIALGPAGALFGLYGLARYRPPPVSYTALTLPTHQEV